RLAIELVVAAVTHPEEGVQFVGEPAALQHQADRVGGTLRRVRHVRGQEEDVALADLNLLGLAVDQDAQPDVPFELVEELLALVDVEVRARDRKSTRLNSS